MKQLSGLLFILFFLPGACRSQQAPDIRTATHGRSLLWELKHPQQPHASYILGTMHILCPEDAWFSPALRQVIQYAGKVYFEADLDDMGQMLTAMMAMVMQDGKTLRDLLSPEEYNRVEAYFKTQAPLPFNMLERFKPLLLSAMVSEQQLPCEATNGMELMIMQEIAASKKPILGLETLAHQASLFDSIPYEVQARELLKAIEDTTGSSAEVDSLLSAYRAQDLDKIERLTIQEESGLAGNLDLLLYGRNRQWVSQLDTILREGPALIAVGAAHLPGDQGVLRLLEKKGYKLRPLANEPEPNKKSL